jgi:hypothetical protein
MGPLPQSPYSQMRQGASQAMLNLNQSQFDRGLQYRKGINDRARRDARRDQKYAAFGAGAGGLANILAMIPGKPAGLQYGTPEYAAALQGHFQAPDTSWAWGR